MNYHNEMPLIPVRGGCWVNSTKYACSTAHNWDHPGHCFDLLGFRVIKFNKTKSKKIRGGSWIDEARHCYSTYHFWSLPDGHVDVLGFRVVKTNHILNKQVRGGSWQV